MIGRELQAGSLGLPMNIYAKLPLQIRAMYSTSEKGESNGEGEGMFYKLDAEKRKDGRASRDRGAEQNGEEALEAMSDILKEEMYPDLPDEIAAKLHKPEVGIDPKEYFEDLPLFPNPFDHSDDPDIEKDPSKVRQKDYDFGNASVMIETRDAVVPQTWETDQLGPPPENRKVRLTVKVRDLNLSVMASQKLVLMTGTRYNFNTDILTLTSDRYPSRKQNGRYLMDLLESLVEESKKETVIEQKPKRLPRKRGKYLQFNKNMLGSGATKKQYEGMIVEE